MRVSKNLAIVLAAGLWACSSGGNDDDDNGNPVGPPPVSGGATNGTFSAQLSGAAWSATGQVTVTRSGGNYIGIAGTGFVGSLAYAVVIGIGNATGPGTHSLNLGAGGDGSSIVVGTSQSIGYGTGFGGGNGSVTITTLTANRIVGTFSGTAIPTTGSGANLVITNGRFDITF
jgi:hypothetical protein